MKNQKVIKDVLKMFNNDKKIYKLLSKYFESNLAATKYFEVTREQNWNYVIDHMAVRTHNVHEMAKKFIKLGWKYDEKVDYPKEGWWAEVYRRKSYPALFIDQSYARDNEGEQIIKNWVNKFGENKIHHIAVLIPYSLKIEEVIKLLKNKGIFFPGKITGRSGSKLRQIFTQAQVVNGYPYTVLELVERNKDPNTGEIYLGFINEQADSLMKDSVL